MKNVKLTFEAICARAVITIDQRPLDAYCDLAAYLGEDFLHWADKLFALLDEEINQEYILEVQGSEFHRLLIEALAERSEFCCRIVFQPVFTQFTIDQHIEEVEKMKARYSSGRFPEPLAQCLICSSDQPELLAPIFPHLQICEDDQASIFATFLEEAAAQSTAPLRIIVSDRLLCRFVRQRVTLYLTKEAAGAFSEYLIHYLYKVPYLQKMKEAFSYMTLSVADQTLLKALEADKPLYLVEKLPAEMACGETAVLNVQVFPAFFGTAGVTVRISDENVLKFAEQTVKTGLPGKCQVEVISPVGEMIASMQVQVVRHNFVESIVITPAFERLHPNSSGMLHFFMSPENAEDADQYEVTSSNNDVVMVKHNGQVIAVKPGMSQITVRTRNAVASYNVRVQCKAESISIRPSTCMIMEDGSVDLNLMVQPADAYVERINWSVDNDVLASITTSGDKKKCTVRAGRRVAYITNVAVQCVADGMTASSSVQIKPYDRKEGLAIVTVIATVLAGFLCWLPFFNVPLWVSTICSLVGGVNNKAGVKTFKHCFVLSIIFWVIGLIIFAAAMSS